MPKSPTDSSLRRDVLASLRTAVVVGAVLTLVNQWALVRSGRLDAVLLARATMNCAVPFCVSLYSRRAAARARQGSG